MLNGLSSPKRHRMDQHTDILDTPIIDTPAPVIYSSRAIAIFTFLLTPLFGGIMAYQNLVRVGKKNNAIQVLIAGFAWVIAIGVLHFYITLPQTFSYALNFAAAWGMGYYVNSVYIPGHQNMPKRKIWVPLAIGVVLYAIIISLVVYALKNE